MNRTLKRIMGIRDETVLEETCLWKYRTTELLYNKIPLTDRYRECEHCTGDRSERRCESYVTFSMWEAFNEMFNKGRSKK